MLRQLQSITILWPPGKTYLFTVLLIILQNVFQNSIAQVPKTRVNIQLLGPEQGLPSRNIRCLAQDGRGFIWLTTGQELWRYDGYTFQNYTETLVRSIGNRSLINKIRTAPDGTIWVTHNNGYSVVDPVRLTCKTFNPSRIIKGAGSAHNLNIFLDKNENAWIAIPGGRLISIDKKHIPVATYTPPPKSSHSFSAESQVTHFFNDNQNNAYLFSDDDFLDEMDSKAKFRRRISLLNDELTKFNFRVHSVVQQNVGGLKIYYQQGSAGKYLMRTYFFETQMFGPLTEVDTPVAPKFISPDNNGHLWLLSETEVGFLNQKTNEFTDLSSRFQQKSGAHTYLFTSLVSSDGSFWLSCVDGLYKITLTDEVFRNI